MSEYWVSTKKYWCKHCNMFVKDSPLSRKDHEASPKHQYALQRFIRNIHKEKEREVVAAENTKREAERLNNLNNPDYVPKPLARRATDFNESKPSSSKSIWRSEDQQRKHMDELAALGIAMPEGYRKEHAIVGEWETVRVIERPPTPDAEAEGVGNDSDEKRIKRRRLDDAGDQGEVEDEEEAETRNFTVRTMEYPGQGTTAAAAASDDIGNLTFKKRGKRKPVLSTMEYPGETGTEDLTTVEIRKKGEPNKAGDHAVESGPVGNLDEEGKNGVEQESSPATENGDIATPGDLHEDITLKQEAETTESAAPVANDGVAFKIRKSKNTSSRRRF